MEKRFSQKKKLFYIFETVQVKKKEKRNTFLPTLLGGRKIEAKIVRRSRNACDSKIS